MYADWGPGVTVVWKALLDLGRYYRLAMVDELKAIEETADWYLSKAPNAAPNRVVLFWKAVKTAAHELRWDVEIGGGKHERRSVAHAALGKIAGARRAVFLSPEQRERIRVVVEERWTAIGE